MIETQRIHRLIMILIIVLLVSGCQDGSTDESQDSNSNVVIESNGETTDYLLYNTNSVEDDHPFRILMKDKRLSDIKYLEMDDLVEITFTKHLPSQVVLHDSILTENGEMKYESTILKEETLDVIDGKAIYRMNENLAALLSSNSKDYEPGATIRGYQLDCTYNDSVYSYYFVLRSDASASTIN